MSRILKLSLAMWYPSANPIGTSEPCLPPLPPPPRSSRSGFRGGASGRNEIHSYPNSLAHNSIFTPQNFTTYYLCTGITVQFVVKHKLFASKSQLELDFLLSGSYPWSCCRLSVSQSAAGQPVGRSVRRSIAASRDNDGATRRKSGRRRHGRRGGCQTGKSKSSDGGRTDGNFQKQAAS